MEILDTLRFANEKLDIKPMTRSRLAAIQRNPKPILETGDVVKVLVYIRPNDTKSYQLWTYVSYDDFKNYDYNTKLNLYHLKDDAEFKEGAFVFPMVGHGLHIMTVSIFDDNLHYRTQIAGKEVVRQITAIYRGEKKQQPLDSNYFENPTDAGKRCVWKKRNNDVIAEKLDIKPMTKSRLDAEKAELQRKPKLLLKTGDILVSGYSKNMKIYQIFIEEKDFKKWNVNPTDAQLYDYTKGTFACANLLYGILLYPLSLYDDDLNKPHHNKTLVEMPFAIYRGTTDIKPPLTNDLVNKLESIVYENNLKCVWESKSIDMNEKLDIKPVTKSRLDSVKKLFSKKPKLLLESGDVLVTEYAGDTRRYQIFVAEKDFKEWKVPMPPTEQDCSQGLFLCKNIIYDILALPVSKYDDNLNLKKSTFIEKAVAIYRNRDIINPPITSNLLLMLVDNIDNLRCVWKADGANINESLGIKPVTRELLKSYSYMKTPKKLLKTGYIAKGEWRNLKNELIDTLFYIYLEYADIEKYEDVIRFEMPSDEVEKAKDGVLVRLTGNIPNTSLSYRYISDMDGNLAFSKFSIVEILKDKNQPSCMDFDYFKRITLDKKFPQTTLIWKRNYPF